MEPTGVQLPAEVTNARARAEELAGVAGQYSAAEPSISDVLRQKVQQAYADNQDIIGELDAAQGSYLAAPQTARAQYEDIFNPFQREALVSQYIQNEALPMLSYSSIYGNRLGRIDDLIGAGTRGYQAEVAARQNEAQLANQSYQNLLNEYQITQALEAQQAAASQPQTQIVEANGRRYLLTYDNQGNVINQQDLGASGSGSGGSSAIDSLLSGILLANLTGGGNPYEIERIDDSPTQANLPTSTSNWQSILGPNISNAISRVAARR